MKYILDMTSDETTAFSAGALLCVQIYFVFIISGHRSLK